MGIILKAENIHKSFINKKGDVLEILKGIDLAIPNSKISMIVGASGAGKSTLLHILGGLDKPNLGSVIFDGTDIFNLSDEKISNFRNLKIGFVFQFHHLLPEFTAVENIAIPMMISGASKEASLKKAGLLLQEVGLEDRQEHKPAELSGGEQQRVAVARALANDPDIIFADEPTGNLDSESSFQVHTLFNKLKSERGQTFLVVTHNQQLIELGEVIFEMKDGKLT